MGGTGWGGVGGWGPVRKHVTHNPQQMGLQMASGFGGMPPAACSRAPSTLHRALSCPTAWSLHWLLDR